MSAFTVVARNRDFRRLFLAELVVFGADWFVMVPLLVLLNKLTGSGLAGGVALAADTGIQALLLPYGGVLADRHDRRRLMISANAAAFVAIGLLLLVRTPQTAWLGPVAVGLVAIAKAFYSPAATAALPNIVDREDLAAANAIGGSAWGTMAVVGSSLGGVLSAAVGPYTSFVVAAASLAVAAALALGVRRPMQAPRRVNVVHVHARTALRESFGYIRRRSRVIAFVTVKSAVGLGNGVLVLFPLLAESHFAPSRIGIGTGLLFAARGLGALAGPLLMRRVLARSSWLIGALAISMVVYGLAYLAASVAPWFPLVLMLVVIAHLAGGGNWVMSSYALQIEVPDALRGRVFAADTMITTLSITASTLIVGLFVDSVSVYVLLAACGGVTLGYAIIWRILTLRLPSRAEAEVRVMAGAS
jgi:MFS family permease